MSERFLRNEMMLGPAAVEKLARSHVCVVGLGAWGAGPRRRWPGPAWGS